MAEPAGKPTQVALEIAERWLNSDAGRDAKSLTEMNAAMRSSLAMAIDAAVEAERAACEAAVEEHIIRHDDPEEGCGTPACESFCECFGISTLHEIRAAIAARRGK